MAKELILIPKSKYQSLFDVKTKSKTEVTDNNMDHAIELALPKNRKEKGLNLYGYLKRQDKSVLDWTQNGNIIYNGQIIPHSHIADLIRDAVVNTKYSPVGFKEFYQALNTFHTPRRLNTNPLRKHYEPAYQQGGQLVHDKSTDVTQKKSMGKVSRKNFSEKKVREMFSEKKVREMFGRKTIYAKPMWRSMKV